MSLPRPRSTNSQPLPGLARWSTYRARRVCDAGGRAHHHPGWPIRRLPLSSVERSVSSSQREVSTDSAIACGSDHQAGGGGVLDCDAD